ncbi:hypothetical protein COCCADRAFT_109211 [Bipolaris zeicola 26-R-13]|uniref:Uncharacterized protein n=1 Tax=Cochliobolus carbonum (strain 26-R-13) TaxID=930089 RepID=W6XSX2_COCC2|nr:uncharacterized protein COCCADRAFT_109211 [Bipolaris zeicola 26-R-13]EUC28430.1 hypothetical protein COCCADRAFT_109211 [Bipolaris zeicola 26-R-13]
MDSLVSAANSTTSSLNFKPGDADFIGYTIALDARDAANGSSSLGFTIATAVGMTQYFYAVHLTLRDKKSPFPLWMHLFYLAHDSSFAYHFACEARKYNYHSYVMSKVIGLIVWTLLEVYCIHRTLTVEHEGLFSPRHNPRQLRRALVLNTFLLLVFYTIVNVPIYLIGPEAWLYWTMLTNVVMAIGPGPYWLQRGCRTGTSRVLAGVNVIGTLCTFWPYSMWVHDLPSVFDSPIFYWAGVPVTLAAGYNFYVLTTLPATIEGAVKKE